MLTEKDLQARKLPELKDLGASLDIPKAKYLKKGELVEAILKATGKTDAAGTDTPPSAPKQQSTPEGAERREQSVDKKLNTESRMPQGNKPRPNPKVLPRPENESQGVHNANSDKEPRSDKAVSYTHLTLPTTAIV